MSKVYNVFKCNAHLTPAQDDFQVYLKSFTTLTQAQRYSKQYSLNHKCITTVALSLSSVGVK